MKTIAIIGSRDFNDLSKIISTLEGLEEGSFKVITGGARGVDTAALEWCSRNNVMCEIIRPIDPAVKINYLYRNIEIITKADEIYAFWDGYSRGSKFVIDYAKARAKMIQVIR